MRYRAIQAHDRRYPIRLMCRTLAVSPAGYYAWRARPESRRSADTRTLLSAIRVIHRESRETYGSPRIWDALIKQGMGWRASRSPVERDGHPSKTVKSGVPPPSHASVPVPRIPSSHSRWRIRTGCGWRRHLRWTTEGWLYLAGPRLYSRRVVGWAMGTGDRGVGPSTRSSWHW